MSRDHRKLVAFRLADALIVPVYEVTQDYPGREIYGLSAQMRRAVTSAPLNIVEGCARSTEGELLRFFDISLGSLRELGYLIEISHRLGFIGDERSEALIRQQEEADRTLPGLISSLRPSAPP
jgi:four helix bundle protein